MKTTHKLIIGSSELMPELADSSIQLIVTSPPYFNAPFDYEGFYYNYDKYLEVMSTVSKEMYRVLDKGRILILNIDDMLVNGVKYPITADFTKILQGVGFIYRDRIIWKKPDGYLRISRRSGVLLQHPYPMYFYPDNLLESLLIFQKGEFDYKSIPDTLKQESKIDLDEFKKNKWYSNLWHITNVLPNAKYENGVAAFPDEIPRRFIKLFSYKGETVLDPFLGSGTTMKVAIELQRNSVGYELKPELEEKITKKLKLDCTDIFIDYDVNFEVIRRF
jgi:site-specific DNA-methyltransferase (adenine-specific)